MTGAAGCVASSLSRLLEQFAATGGRVVVLGPDGATLGDFAAAAIARWIVDSHAGTIELADRDGGGTVAVVTLPVRAS